MAEGLRDEKMEYRRSRRWEDWKAAWRKWEMAEGKMAEAAEVEKEEDRRGDFSGAHVSGRGEITHREQKVVSPSPHGQFLKLLRSARRSCRLRLADLCGAPSCLEGGGTKGYSSLLGCGCAQDARLPSRWTTGYGNRIGQRNPRGGRAARWIRTVAGAPWEDEGGGEAAKKMNGRILK